MHQFRPYAEKLQELAQLCSTKSVIEEAWVDRALNGEAAETLFAKVPVDVLRRAGAFFTPPALAQKLIDRVASQLVAGKTVLDPACGAGDLLLACARHLPVDRDLTRTLIKWGRQLHGFDIHPEFVIATKARLMLLAITRGATRSQSVKLRDRDLFPNIRVADFLAITSLEQLPNCIVVNPPFQRSTAPKGVTWGTGLVTRAAVFIDKCTEVAPIGTVISALLPDVLRSGTRYTHWRRFVERRATPSDVELAGIFNRKADVNVFLVTFERKQSNPDFVAKQWLPNDATVDPGPTLASICDVRVGPVVPFRDPLRGPSHPYVTTAELPAWKTTVPFSKRKYRGEAFPAPFVAVRRTSRPNDPRRAVGTIVRSDEPVAVENHLIILLPKKRATLVECRYLLRVLKDPRTTTWLNERICCRHLTTTALKQLPLWLPK